MNKESKQLIANICELKKGVPSDYGLKYPMDIEPNKTIGKICDIINNMEENKNAV
jgi:hypothetical protein